MLGRIILVLVLVFVASLCGIIALAFDPSQKDKTLDEIARQQEDLTTLPGCLTIISILSFGALMLLGLMWFVYGFLGADPHGASSLPWVAR